jgi:hypothetical protein
MPPTGLSIGGLVWRGQLTERIISIEAAYRAEIACRRPSFQCHRAGRSTMNIVR